MLRFFVANELNISSELLLPLDVVRHLQVTRVKLNQQIILFNGTGIDYLANILDISRRSIAVEVIEKKIVTNLPLKRITLLSGVLVGDKYDLVIQKAVELGVVDFYPVISSRSQPIKRLENKLAHWNKVIISASEQCGRSELMNLYQPIELSAIVKQNQSKTKLILSPHHDSNDNSILSDDITLLVGSEGGFTTDEVQLANEYGFSNLSLGNIILRAETAVIASLSLVQFKL